LTRVLCLPSSVEKPAEAVITIPKKAGSSSESSGSSSDSEAEAPGLIPKLQKKRNQSLKEGKKKVQVKKKSKPELTKAREDECFSCGDAGQMVSCKRAGCPKVYHADCLNLTRRPAGQTLRPSGP